mmetsp:Transcript_3726/g.9175  ORF Transcript_3726/g.9175 Transcript_3726/m.9175 type:complete len:557 (+) Transcript_3726:193-1863(+)
MATVELAIYDLTMGMAKQMAAPLAGLLDGKSVEMVPHTGVRVFGREIVYAGGVLSQPISTVEAGMGRKPNSVERIGTTTKTEAEVQQFLRSISHEWTAQNYDLWEHNCNNFSERVAQFLTGSSIPRWILDFPREMRSTPLGQMLAPMLGTSQDALNGQLGTSGYVAPSATPATPMPAPAPPAPAPGDAMAVTVKPATGSNPPKTLSLSKTATVGDLRKVLGVDASPRFVFMGKLLADDSKTLASYGVADGLTVLQVAGRGSPQSSPAPAAAAAPTTATTPLSASIARAEASGGVDVLRTLHRILSNIVQHPTEAKYRQLKTTNAAFQRKCLNHDGARDVLIAAGFVESEGVLTMTPSAQAYPVLTAAERALSARLDAIEAAARPAQPAGMPDLSALMGGGLPGMGGAGMGNVMQELQRNPILMQQVQRLMSDPQAMQRAMETIQRNPQLAQMMAQRMQGGGGMPDPQTMARMMQDPAVQAQMRQLQASLGGGLPPMGGGGGAGPDPGALAAALAGLNNGTGGGAAPPQANNVNENGDAMSEEEAIQEAIRRSMREQ